MKHLLLLLAFTAGTYVAVAQNGDFKLDKEYTIGQTGTLDLRSSDAKVFITGTVRKTAHVKIERSVNSKGVTWGDENFAVEVKEDNGNVVIRERSNGVRVGVIGYYEENYKIEIEVPMGVSLRIEGDDGDYFIKYVAGSISLTLDDADAELRSCNGTSFTFRLDDGDLTMDKAQGEMDIQADDADVEIRNANLTALKANIDDGDLIIQTSLVSTGSYSFDAEDGSIVLNITSGGAEFDIRHDDGRVITEGNFSVKERDENRTQITLADGSAKVSMRCDDGRVRLTSSN